jgi:hypothetical protein
MIDRSIRDSTSTCTTLSVRIESCSGLERGDELAKITSLRSVASAPLLWSMLFTASAFPRWIWRIKLDPKAAGLSFPLIRKSWRKSSKALSFHRCSSLGYKSWSQPHALRGAWPIGLTARARSSAGDYRAFGRYVEKRVFTQDMFACTLRESS